MNTNRNSNSLLLHYFGSERVVIGFHQRPTRIPSVGVEGKLRLGCYEGSVKLYWGCFRVCGGVTDGRLNGSERRVIQHFRSVTSAQRNERPHIIKFTPNYGHATNPYRSCKMCNMQCRVAFCIALLPQLTENFGVYVKCSLHTLI